MSVPSCSETRHGADLRLTRRSMPRPNSGPRLRLRQPRGYARPVWFIEWYERRHRRAKSTGLAQSALREAEAALAAFLAQRPRRPDGRRDPADLPIAEALRSYLVEHGPEIVDEDRIKWCIRALSRFWDLRMVAEVRGETCRQYARQRKGEGIKDGTIARELETLQAALNHCVREGYLVWAPKVTKPKRPPPREHWLTRSQAASLIRVARREFRSRRHLPCSFWPRSTLDSVCAPYCHWSGSPRPKGAMSTSSTASSTSIPSGGKRQRSDAQSSASPAGCFASCAASANGPSATCSNEGLARP